MDGLKLSQGCRIISRLRSHVAWSTWWLKMASQVGLEEPMYRRYTIYYNNILVYYNNILPNVFTCVPTFFKTISAAFSHCPRGPPSCRLLLARIRDRPKSISLGVLSP